MATPLRRAEDLHSPAELTRDRRRHVDPHPDEIREAAGVALFYGADLGPLGEDVIRRVLVASKSWRDRRDADERAHARLRDDIARRMALRGPKPVEHTCAVCEGRGQLMDGRECEDCQGEGVL